MDISAGVNPSIRTPHASACLDLPGALWDGVTLVRAHTNAAADRGFRVNLCVRPMPLAMANRESGRGWTALPFPDVMEHQRLLYMTAFGLMPGESLQLSPLMRVDFVRWCRRLPQEHAFRSVSPGAEQRTIPAGA